MTQVRYNLRHATAGAGVRATPAASPKTQSRVDTTSSLTSPTPGAAKGCTPSPSRTGECFYSKVVSGQVSHVSSLPRGQSPDGVSPSEPAVPAEAVAKVPEANGSTGNTESNKYSLEKDVGIARPKAASPKAVSANKYSVYCSTQTSTSSDDSKGWTTVKRKKDQRSLNKLSPNKATESSNSNSNMLSRP